MTPDFESAFASLRDVLRKHAADMVVLRDGPGEYMVATRAVCPNGHPMFFGWVRAGKGAVTYHLMPLYSNPALQAAVPEALRRRKQGKSCFNFRRPDPELFALIDELTRQGREHFERHGFLEAGPVPPERMDAALRAGGEDPERIARVHNARGRQAAAKRAATLGKRRTASGAKRQTRTPSPRGGRS